MPFALSLDNVQKGPLATIGTEFPKGLFPGKQWKAESVELLSNKISLNTFIYLTLIFGTYVSQIGLNESWQLSQIFSYIQLNEENKKE